MATATMRLIGLGLAALSGAALASATEAARFYYADLSFESYASANVSAGAINNNSQFVGARAFTQFGGGLPWVGRMAEPLAMVPGVSFQSATTAGLNESGQFAGVGTWFNGTMTTYRYTPGVGIQVLGSLDGAGGWVVDINAFGAVAGTWSIVGGPYQGGRAFIYTDAGGFQQLPTLGGHDAYATDMNDAGYIVGSSRVTGPINRMRACYWHNGQCFPLGPPDVWSSTARINNAGAVLGSYIDAGQQTRGFIQEIGGAWQPVPAPTGATIAVGQDINELGQIVGVSDVGAYLHTPEQGVELIDVGFTPSMLNNAGHVVGTLLEPPYVNKGWFWSRETGSVRIDDVIVPALPWSVSTVTDFNDRNEMLVNGFYAGHDVAAVVFPTKKGDLNCDGVVDFLDIDPFVAALGGQAAYDAVHPNCNWPSADTNDDDTVNFLDIDGFVALLGT